MLYTALYRKFRPLNFNEIVGQEHIIKTLKNQIINNRVGHAYLFSGGRGTGKTSAAKVLARAVNCLNASEGEPCNECEICKSAINGSLTDIIEMDAASNNGVEDIRQIRETVNFLPSLAKYRVYIIDEVHMLSTGAFNALLKTLEEPPAHVKFILATTEPQKLPATILSRCQRFDFKKIANEYIIQRLEIICRESKIEITREALKLIAVLSEGGMRDAISILERCVQDGEVNITEDKIKELVGIPKLYQISKIVENIIKYNSQESLKIAEEIISEGKDIANCLWEIIKYVKDILVYKASSRLDIYSEEEKIKIKEISENVSTERLVKIIEELSELQNDLKWSNQRNIIFETGIIKLSSNYSCSGYNEFEKRLLNIEEQLKSGKKESKEDNPNLNNDKSVKNTVESQDLPKKKETKVESFLEKPKKEKKLVTNESLQNWNLLVNKLKNSGKMMLYTNLANTTAKEINDMTVGIEFKKGLTAFGRTVLEQPENMQYLVKAVSQLYGKEMRIKFIDGKMAQGKKIGNNDNGDNPFNIID